MNKIIFPLKREMRGPDVRDLQDVLSLLLDRRVILPSDENARQELAADIQSEREQQFFSRITVKAVSIFQREQQLEVSGAVDEVTARRFNEIVDSLEPSDNQQRDGRFVVRGTAIWADGKPYIHKLIRAFDVDMRTEQSLGETISSDDGSFEIGYEREQFARAEKRSADLRICACNDGGIQLASTQTIFNATPLEILPDPLVVPMVEESEFETLLRELSESIRQGVPIRELTNEDLLFLANELKLDLELLNILVISHDLASILDVDPVLLYGLFRQGLSSLPRELLAVRLDEQQTAIKRSIELRIIPDAVSVRLEETLRSLRRALISFLDSPKDSSDDDRPRLFHLLNTTRISADIRAKLIDHLLDTDAKPEDLNEELAMVISDADRTQIDRAIRLDALTQGNLPLVHTLQKRFDAGEFSTLHDLARLSGNDWATFVRETDEAQSHIPLRLQVDGAASAVKSYVNEVTDVLQGAYPEIHLRKNWEGDRDIRTDLVERIYTQVPNADPRRPLPKSVVDVLPTEDHEAAHRSWKAIGEELTEFHSLTLERYIASGFKNEIRSGVNRLLSNVPELEKIKSVNIDHVISEQDTAVVFAGIQESDRDKVVEHLKATQRVLRVAPRADDTQILMRSGFRSAASISHIPAARFATLNGKQLGGADRALHIHKAAQQRSSTAELSYVALKQSYTEVLPYVIDGTVEAQNQAKKDLLQVSPNLETLFENQDFCECELCRSVLSPAAYLVDLFNYIDISPNSNGDTPLDVLFDRRPDLEHIRLSCGNTLTRLPYIDLVNEVLESYLVSRFINQDDPVLIEVFDTGDAKEEEMLAIPQNINSAAYDLPDGLKNTVYPLSLPFDRPLEVTRTYLAQLGVKRHKLMSLWFDSWPTNGNGLNNWGPKEAIAAERIGLSRLDRDLIVGLDARPLYEMYGYTNETIQSNGNTIHWQEDISHVPMFLRRTGLTLVEIREVLKSQFLNPELYDENLRTTLHMEVEADEVPDCDISNLRLRFANDDSRNTFFTNAHRLVRLQRKLGWSFTHLDRALWSVNPIAIELTAGEDGSLVKLAVILEFKEEVRKTDFEHLLTLWSDLSTWGDESIYRNTFQNPKLIAESDISAFALDTDRKDLAVSNQELVTKLSTVLAACRLTTQDFEILVSANILDVNHLLNLATLSTAFRYSVLRRVLRLRIDEIIAVLRIEKTTPTPFEINNPRAVLNFTKSVKKISESPIDISTLVTIYSQPVQESQNALPDNSIIQNNLESLITALREAATELALPGLSPTKFDYAPNEWVAVDPDGKLLRERLAIAVRLAEENLNTPNNAESLAAVETAISLLNGVHAAVPLQENAADFFETFFTKHFSHFIDASSVASAKTDVTTLFNLTDPPIDSTDTATIENLTQNNRGWLFSQLMPWLWSERRRGVLVQALAQILELEEDVIDWLIHEGMNSVGLSVPATDQLSKLVNKDIDLDDTKLMRLLQKSSLLLRTTTLTKRELDYIYQNKSLFGEFDLNSFATDSNVSPQALQKQRERIFEYVALRDSLPTARANLIDIFEAVGEVSNLTELHSLWAELCGWSEEETTDVLGAEGLNLQIDDFKSDLQLHSALDLRDMRKRVGVSVQVLGDWAVTQPDWQQGEAVINAARARYSAKEWLEIAKSLNDPLREKQRDMLVACLLPRIGFDSSNQLFEFFLLDVEMSSCMATSRLKQATLSTQLFVDRCFLSLEQQVEPDAIDKHQWRWRKNYRVWEANRKVFLYPENWIKPELRLDKSLFFEELEDELLQDEVTKETAERAYLNYMDKLFDVGNLQVVGHYSEYNSYSKSSITHVFARSANTPSRHYYRLLKGREWTPWQRVNLDIQSEHVIPVVFQGRLLLFWAVFEKKPMGGDSGQAPEEKWEIQVYMSEYRDNRWIAPIKGDGILESQSWVEIITSTSTGTSTPLKPPALLTADDYAFSAVSDFLKAYKKPKDLTKFELIEDWFVTLQNFINAGLKPEYNKQPPEPSYWVWLLQLFKQLFVDDVVFISSDWNDAWQEFFEEYELWRDAYLNWLQNDYAEDSFKIATKSRLTHEAAPITNHTFRITKDINRLVVNCYVDKQSLLFPSGIYIGRFSLDECTGKLIVGRTGQSTTSLMAAIADMGGLSQTQDMTISEQGAAAQNAKRLATISLAKVIGQSLEGSDSGFFPNILKYDPPGNVLNTPGSGWTLVPSAGNELHLFSHPFFFHSQGHSYFAQSVDDSPRPPVFQLMDASDSTTSTAALSNATRVVSAEAVMMPMVYRSTQHERTISTPVSQTMQAHITSMSMAVRNAIPFSNMRVTRVNTPSTQTTVSLSPDLEFSCFQHLHVCDFIKDLRGGGVEKMLTLENQNLTASQNEFEKRFTPTDRVAWPYPIRDVDFDPDGAYALYNWECCFYIPMLIHERLKAEGHYEEAHWWISRVLDVSNDDKGDDVSRFWRFKPFHENKTHLNALQLVQTIADPSPNAVTKKLQKQIATHIEDWEERPFEPHRAVFPGMRLTNGMVHVVMKCCDNLIDWGDALFRRDTMESINEATQIYILAANILGRRPRRLPTIDVPAPTFAELRPHLDQSGTLSNPIIDLENVQVELPFSVGPADPEAPALPSISLQTIGLEHETDNGVLVRTLAFCIPNNDQLLQHWDTVEDRLFKIRNCLNIEGVERELRLFEPPIDPALLVKAVAAGLDISSVLSDLHAPLPPYRFQQLIQKAYELVNEVKSLGASCLAAREKRDAEELVAKRAQHETSLLKTLKGIRKEQVEESRLSRSALEAAEAVIAESEEHYKQHVEGSKKRLSSEIREVRRLRDAKSWSDKAGGFEISASIQASIPNFSWGTSGNGGHSTISMGGSTSSAVTSAIARGMRMESEAESHKSTLSGINARRIRQADEWALQFHTSEKDHTRIKKDIERAKQSETIAESEVENVEQQIERAKEIEDFLRYKFTNKQHYNWAVTDTSRLYYQTYKIAYDFCKRLERAYFIETGDSEASFIQFGHWETGRKGLMAGERLGLDLRRLETAYLEKNKREYEITKHISLVLHDPLALIRLKHSGRCEITLPEAMFDADYPGHYFRRIKSVSLTIPSVVGPYTSINCHLTLLRNAIRHNPMSTAADHYELIDETRFYFDYAPLQRIATSHGQSDAGLFELNFRDERYLPFEPSGAISHWRIDLPPENNAFDLDTINDVVLTIRYTAREGGERLKSAVTEARKILLEGAGQDIDQQSFQPLRRMFSIKHEFPDAWQKFIQDDGGSAVLKINHERFPYLFRGEKVITEIQWLAIQVDSLANTMPDTLDFSGYTLTAPEGTTLEGTDMNKVPWDPSARVYRTWVENVQESMGKWGLLRTANSPNHEQIDDLILVITYQLE